MIAHSFRIFLVVFLLTPFSALAGEVASVYLPVGSMSPVQAWWNHYPERLLGWDYQTPRRENQPVPVFAPYPVQWVVAPMPQVVAAPVYFYQVAPAYYPMMTVR